MLTKWLNFMVKNKEENTENKILEAAKRIFQQKGLFGARMQEIADEAGINKALLHYYFRSKDLLFEAVFTQAIGMMAPKIDNLLNSDMPLEYKIKHISEQYITFLNKHPYLPNFVFHELNRNPKFLEKMALQEKLPGLDGLKRQLDQLIVEGKIIPISAEQLFINILSLNIFPFIGKPLLKVVTKSSEEDFKALIEERKVFIADFIMNAITVKS